MRIQYLVGNNHIFPVNFVVKFLFPSNSVSLSTMAAAAVEEDIADQQLNHLMCVFPDVCPEYLHGKVVEFAGNEGAMLRYKLNP